MHDCDKSVDRFVRRYVQVLRLPGARERGGF